MKSVLNGLFNLDEDTVKQLQDKARKDLKSIYGEDQLENMRKEDEAIFDKLNRIADERNQHEENN